MRRMSMSRLQNLSSWRQRHHEQPLGIPGKAWAPSSPMELSPKSMLVTEVFVFKASASAWPKGKRHGSRSKLTSVRPCEIQRRQNSQFPTPSFQRTNPTGFRANVVDTEMHFQPISCQYPSRKHTTSYHTEWVQVKKKFTHFTRSQLNLKTWKCQGWARANYKAFQRTGDKNNMSSHLKSRDTKGLHSFIADGIATQVDACHGSVLLQSFSQCLATRESDMEVDQGWHLWDLMKYKWDTTLSFPTLSFQRTNPTESRIQNKCRLQRCILRQYHANIPVESIPHHTTQNEFKSKRNSPTSLAVN